MLWTGVTTSKISVAPGAELCLEIKGNERRRSGSCLGPHKDSSGSMAPPLQKPQPGQSFLTEEEEVPSESSTEWDLGGFSELDSESGSSSSLSDDDLWVQVAPQ